MDSTAEAFVYIGPLVVWKIPEEAEIWNWLLIYSST